MTEQQATPTSLDDLSLARAVAEAVCQIPAVLELSAGRFAREGTYGPGEFVRGVVLQRPTPDSLEVDVRVVLAEQALRGGLAARRDGYHSNSNSGGFPRSGGSASTQPQQRPRARSASSNQLSLLDLSEQIRIAIQRALVQAGQQPARTINVFFDDVR
ncbi:hypothetical protein [Thermogemmatispora tikiterensis]|uniref:Uncharacterized protein n=1 Tax=Thermogemmatispora tikiterensis TaxID=1825093 RepID=A0A328VDC4_9CHLR|nr:hypothetical protein [Thermogemmatispora tikiterensis]RAQ95686.1 hypothetical protein A4R35_09085 [Thermogemmatispora tikiterensis]